MVPQKKYKCKNLLIKRRKEKKKNKENITIKNYLIFSRSGCSHLVILHEKPISPDLSK